MDCYCEESYISSPVINDPLSLNFNKTFLPSRQCRSKQTPHFLSGHCTPKRPVSNYSKPPCILISFYSETKEIPSLRKQNLYVKILPYFFIKANFVLLNRFKIFNGLDPQVDASFAFRLEAPFCNFAAYFAFKSLHEGNHAVY